MTQIQVFRQQDYRQMKWKNGQGTTAEISICPPEAVFPKEPFLWRLSSAAVLESGPFSKFPGYDRCLTLVGGSSLLLQGEQDTLLKTGQVYRFSGDAEMSCQLAEGQIQDLNLIFNRTQVKAEFEIIKLGRKPRSFQSHSEFILVFAINGAFSITAYPGEKKSQLRIHDTLQMTGASEEKLILLEPVSTDTPECLIAWIEINRIRAQSS